jgi:hypothetical protein
MQKYDSLLVNNIKLTGVDLRNVSKILLDIDSSSTHTTQIITKAYTLCPITFEKCFKWLKDEW